MLDRYTTAGLSYINLDLASPFANETADPAGAARFRLAARHVASVNKGDCLWIPAYWHHEVLSSETEETLAFSLWYVPTMDNRPIRPVCFRVCTILARICAQCMCVALCRAVLCALRVLLCALLLCSAALCAALCSVCKVPERVDVSARVEAVGYGR